MINNDYNQLPPAILEKIYQIIYKITNITPQEQNLDKNFKTEIGLDSLQMLRIATAIEDQLGIELPVNIIEVNTLNAFLRILKEEFDKKNVPNHQ